jgi:UPF0755 protein
LLIRRLIQALLVAVLMAGAAGIWLWNDYQRFLNTASPLPESRTFTIKKGTYFNTLVAQLEAESVIDKPLYLKLAARLEPHLARIKAGEYVLDAGMTPRAMLEKFSRGDTLKYHFTIVEGMRFSELRAALAQETGLVQQLPDMSDAQVLEALALDAPSPEGLFLAETYQYEKGISDLDLLRRANRHLEQVLQEAWASRRESLPLASPYEALILASIVEKETGVPEERPRIAGVFVRRLEKGMRLQTDPTVIYGMGDAYDGNIRRRDLRTPTPYNTYTIDGLPPTPIALVGPDAIHAAVQPEPGEWLYFVARGDGSHQFSKTLREHNRAVAKFQLKRREDYRSSPEQ